MGLIGVSEIFPKINPKSKKIEPKITLKSIKNQFPTF